MKQWNTPEINELQINMTAQGGSDLTQLDNYWTDQDGNAWTSYASGATNIFDDKVKTEY